MILSFKGHYSCYMKKKLSQCRVGVVGKSRSKGIGQEAIAVAPDRHRILDKGGQVDGYVCGVQLAELTDGLQVRSMRR